MKINANFDSGAIEVISIDQDKREALLNVPYDAPDCGKPFLQWFHFRVAAMSTGHNYTFRLCNASKTSYPDGWPGYRVYASYNRESWFCLSSTSYDGTSLSWTLTPSYSSIFFAYYPPYSQERHLDFLSKCQTSRTGRCKLAVLGETLDGNTIDALLVGDKAPTLPSPIKTLPGSMEKSQLREKLALWVVGRQHPGETQASWWMEGFVQRLLDPADPVVRKVLSKGDVFIVPNMNPDGSRRGYLRVNSSGSNLNREWLQPSLEKSPEVYRVQQYMFATGVDFCLDVHSDEELPYVFVSWTPRAVPSATEARHKRQDRYEEALRMANPDFQRIHGYPKEAAGTANLSILSAWAAETFGCLSMTQEMPFKDNIEMPDEEGGWSIERCKRLGASCVDGLYAVLDTLRSV